MAFRSRRLIHFRMWSRSPRSRRRGPASLPVAAGRSEGGRGGGLTWPRQENRRCVASTPRAAALQSNPFPKNSPIRRHSPAGSASIFASATWSTCHAGRAARSASTASISAANVRESIAWVAPRAVVPSRPFIASLENALRLAPRFSGRSGCLRGCIADSGSRSGLRCASREASRRARAGRGRVRVAEALPEPRRLEGYATLGGSRLARMIWTSAAGLRRSAGSAVRKRCCGIAVRRPGGEPRWPGCLGTRGCRGCHRQTRQRHGGFCREVESAESL
jgi:hypothetical protein